MKWVKWNIGSDYNPDYSLEEVCKNRFENLMVTEKDFYKDDDCSFYSIENCRYSHDIPNHSTDEIILFGDVEIFNLSELSNKYGLEANENSLINLYLICGHKIFKELNGEYCFSLFDKRKMHLYLVVDALGVKDIFWNYSNNVLTAATDLFLLESENLKRWNKQYFKDFQNVNGIYTGDETPYSNVFRVSAGHYISINLATTEVNKIKYWDLKNLEHTTYFKTEEEYFSKFRNLLVQSIGRRMLPNYNGIAMSGGLDSTTLFALSKEHIKASEFLPFSGVFPTLEDCDETDRILHICKMYNTEPNLVDCDNCGMLINYPDEYPMSYEPYAPALSSSFTMKILEFASNNKIVNLFDGYAADELLTGTPLTAIDLMKRGRVSSSLRYTKDSSYMFDESIYQSFIKAFIRKESSGIDVAKTNYLADKLKDLNSYNKRNIYTQLFYARTFSFLDRDLAPIYNISLRHPFLDKELIEFIYTIPGEILLQKGVDKYIIRNGMKDYLPDSLINKTQKTQHVNLSFKGINSNWSSIYQDAMRYNHQMFDETKIGQWGWSEMLQNFRSGKSFNDEIFTRLCLELWLSDKL